MSLTKYLQDNYIATNLVWEPADVEIIKVNNSAYAKWLSRIQSTNRALIYYLEDGSFQRAYSEKSSSVAEPLAILIRKHFGDGIYYFHDDEDDDDGNVYFVIIFENRVVTGTDYVVTKDFFNELLGELHGFNSGYEHLGITEIDECWLQEEVFKSKKRVHKINKKRRMFIVGAFSVGGAVFVLLAILINVFIT